MAMLRRKEESYEGHFIAAAPGTHVAAMGVLMEYCTRDAAILDFGCHSGAMIQRLRHAGFHNLTGTDLSPHFNNGGDFQFVAADLNGSFSDKFEHRNYDALVVSEVIEHLDDPRHFLAEARKLIKPRGLIVLTTPNIAFFEGRLKFLIKGELWGFGAKNYLGQRHISPLTREQSAIMLRECGFQLVEMFTAGSFATPLRRILTAPLWIPMRLFLGPSVLGESLLIVARQQEMLDCSATSTALWA